MAARNTARAKRRIAERTRKNALALAAVAEIAAEPPKLVRAPTRTRLEELHARGVISIEQRQAGERLAKDYAWSGEPLGHLVERYEPWTPKGTGVRFNDAPGQIDARRRFEAALQTVGKWLSPVLVHTCLCDLAPCHWATARGAPGTDGIAVLKLALDALGGHYRAISREAA
jgi:hypothetical protein